MAQGRLLKWMTKKSTAKVQFEEWVKAQEAKGLLIQLRSSLTLRPIRVDMEVFAGPFIGNEHLNVLLENIVEFKEVKRQGKLKVVEVKTKEQLIFHFIAKPSKEYPEDAWGNRILMGDRLILKGDCKYIGFAQVNRKEGTLRFARNKTFWDKAPLNCLTSEDVPEFLAWVDEFQSEPGVETVVSAIRERDVWIRDELIFTCFYMTTTKQPMEWANILDIWLEEVNS